MGPDHLSRIESGEDPASVEDNLFYAQLFAVTVVDKKFEAIIQLLSIGYAPEGFTTAQKKQLDIKAFDYMLIVEHLYKMGPDEILRHHVFDYE